MNEELLCTPYRCEGDPSVLMLSRLFGDVQRQPISVRLQSRVCHAKKTNTYGSELYPPDKLTLLFAQAHVECLGINISNVSSHVFDYAGSSQ